MSSDTPRTVARWTTADIRPAEHGGFVAYGDYLSLQRELAAVTADMHALGRALLVQTECAKQLGRLVDEKDNDRILFRDKAERAEAECAALRKDAERVAELEGYNVGLAEEVRVVRNALDDLVDAIDGSSDMDEMDGPEYQVAQERLDSALAAARPHTEKAITQIAIDAAIAQGGNK